MTRNPAGNSAILRCYDTNGGIYYINFACDRLIVTSHSNDAILAKIDIWADPVTPLCKMMAKENKILLMGAFFGAGLPACVIIPGMLVILNRILDHME